MNRLLSSSSRIVLAAMAVAGMTGLAQAEGTISVFGGANFSPHSSTSWSFPGAGPSGSAGVGWEGESFQMPPYYGVRATWWLEDMPNIGFSAEFTHAKVAADLSHPALVADGISTLEMTDGINFAIINGMYRWQMDNGLTPYVGAGVGLSIPHVEFSATGVPETREYQVTGVAVQALAGVSYEFVDNWSVFGEFKSTYGQVKADLNGGGKLDTNIISNQVILGLTYKFW